MVDLNKIEVNFNLPKARILYHYVGGSHLYGLNTPQSDVDTKGIYICDENDILGIGINYKEQINDSKNDNVLYEVGRYMHLLLKSNPTVFEGLFAPDDMVIVKPHPYLAPLFDNKNEFVTKACLKPIFGYAVEQIKKARGLNKKIVNPINERLTPFDFAYTFYKQGSTKVKDWLENRGLDKDLCGLVHVPNMHDTYGIYYDWGKHIEKYNITEGSFTNVDKFIDFIEDFFEIHEKNEFANWLNKNSKPIGYRGICLEAANEMRLSSVSKGERPICYMVYNESGYTAHCKQYKEYQEWVKMRNPVRYESNLDKNYDSKNVMHCFRLMHMGLEIAKGEGVNIRRTWDRDFLMNIRNHKFEYDYLMEELVKRKAEFDEAIKTTSLKNDIDVNLVNDILLDIRKKFNG